MNNETLGKTDNTDNNPWLKMAKEVETERNSNIGQEVLREVQRENIEMKEIARNDEADLRIWQRVSIGSRGLAETEWRKNATVSELEERKEFDRQVNEITAISRGDEYGGRGREGAVELARKFFSSPSYNKYAVTAAMGPSIVMDIIEENPDAVGDFDMGSFVSKLSDPNLDKNTTWELNCRMLIATQLERYTSPELGVDVKKFVDSESTKTKLFTLGHIINANPNFNTEEFLAEACEDEPSIVCSNASDYLKLGFNFPITEIERKLRVEAKQKVKDEPENEWKKYYVNNFEGDISRLMEVYEQYGKLSEDDKKKIDQELNKFHKDALGEERTQQREIVLDDVLQETIDSFNGKYQEYQDKIIQLQQQWSNGHKITLNECEERQAEAAAETFAKLDSKEISYFRREFIRRSYLYDGDESYSDSEDIAEHLSAYQAIAFLNEADKDFRESDEFGAYKKRASEKEKRDCIDELSNMSEEDLHTLRRQRLEYELNDVEPVPYRNDNGDWDWDKRKQNERIKTLWKYDSGWDESEEGKEAAGKNREKWADKAAKEWAELLVKYPDIFKNPDLDEIDKLVEETIGKIPRDKVYEIGKLKESGRHRQADQAEIDLFVSVFGLEYRPNIEYSDKDTDCKGSYAHRLKRVEVRRKFGGRDDEDAIMNTIAHEMWHAHQHDEVDHNTKRGEKYKVNNEHYQNGQPGWDLLGGKDIIETLGNFEEAYNRYRNQLLEVEAFTFGQAFADYYRDVMENGVNATDDTSGEIDDLIKEKQKVEAIKSMSPYEILDNLSNLRESGFSDKEITNYLAHCYSFSTEDGKETIVNTMIDNSVDIPHSDQDGEPIDYDTEYGSDLMVKHADKLLEIGISEIDIIDSLYYDDSSLDWIEYNDGSSVGRRSFFNNKSVTMIGEDVVYRSSGIQDLLLAVYQNEVRQSNITKARSRIEKAISHFQDLRGVESSEQREKEKTEYLFEMIERMTGR